MCTFKGVFACQMPGSNPNHKEEADGRSGGCDFALTNSDFSSYNMVVKKLKQKVFNIKLET